MSDVSNQKSIRRSSGGDGRGQMYVLRCLSARKPALFYPFSILWAPVRGSGGGSTLLHRGVQTILQLFRRPICEAAFCREATCFVIDRLEIGRSQKPLSHLSHWNRCGRFQRLVRQLLQPASAAQGTMVTL